MEYIQRLADSFINNHLQEVGAVLIGGAKFCGKTETAKKLARTSYSVDTDIHFKNILSLEPGRIFSAKTPILFDEWQEEKTLWGLVRHEVDNRKIPGQFILTGSANPIEDVKLHSGAGRISRINMKTLTWQELGYSTLEVPFEVFFDKNTKPSSAEIKLSLEELANRIVVGGWPALAHKSEKQASIYLRDYVDLISEVDISRVSARKRDPERVRRLLRSYARNTTTFASNETLTRDTSLFGGEIDRNSVADYLDALRRLMIIDEIPAWTANIRSTIPFRLAPKRHFIDPSLAIHSLGLTSKKIIDDLEYFGFLFESQVFHDISVYAKLNDARVYHYHDSDNNEVDLIIEKRDGTYAAIEVKMAFSAVENAAASLKKFSNLVDKDFGKYPETLNVITLTGFAHKRSDGVNVIPYSTLFAQI